jgi:hypothetical protein
MMMANDELIAALQLHAFDDCGGLDIPTHVCNIAAQALAADAARIAELEVEVARQGKVRWEYAKGVSIDEIRANVSSILQNAGDCRMVWVNEGDWIFLGAVTGATVAL